MSIYDTIGGPDAVAAAVDEFYGRVLADEELRSYFAQTDLKRLRAHQRGFIAAAIGGPEIYRGRSMREAHAGLNVTPEHFDRVVGHLVDTLAGLGVPQSTIGEIGAKLAPLKADIASTVEPRVSPITRWRRRWLPNRRELAR
ncbi:group I truncated hemoglobin [Pseudonocardia sp. Cha107L01]|uniref:group I truncated hemoglobin n=1 Tax=Pseudonocardia sp. Cha107L01 TaxID=3457576 RepID=UPI00403E6038